MSRLSSYLRSRMHGRRNSSGSASEHVPSKYSHGVQGQICKGTQILLAERYRELVRTCAPLPAFVDVEFRNYSQNGEDGILLFIFAVAGMKSRRCVEICAGDGIECNSANLILNHGFEALLVDGDARNVAVANDFYQRHRDTFAFAPKAVRQWVTVETIDGFLREQGMTGEIDLLTIDIDGNDYWIWQAIECVSPRVVVVEYENAWGPEEAVTMRYDPAYVWRIEEPGMPHSGASLAAFAKLARAKGYRLVGCQSRCFNAFFVRDDIGRGSLPEVTVASCLTSTMSLSRQALRYSRPHSPLLERFVNV